MILAKPEIRVRRTPDGIEGIVVRQMMNHWKLSSSRSLKLAAICVLMLGVPGARCQDVTSPVQVANGGLTSQEVSFMDFSAIDVESVIARIPQTDFSTLYNLRRFAAFEAAHNSRGAAEQARRIAECIDASGLVQARSAGPAAPSTTAVPTAQTDAPVLGAPKASLLDTMKKFLKVDVRSLQARDRR